MDALVVVAATTVAAFEVVQRLEVRVRKLSEVQHGTELDARMRGLELYVR